MGFDRSGDAAGNFILHGEDVAELPVVAFSPVMGTRKCVDELGANSQPIAAAAHTAFQHIAHAKLARDLAHVDRAVLVDERGVSSDDEQPSDAGKSGDQILCEAISEVVLIGIATHIGEGQHCDRGTIGQRQGRKLRRVCLRADYGGHLVLPHIANEAEAFAWQCLDQPLFFAGIAECTAGRIDAVEQGGFRNNPPLPDGGQQLILADHPVAVPDQMNKKIENLRLDSNQGASPAQFAAVRVEYAILE